MLWTKLILIDHPCAWNVNWQVQYIYTVFWNCPKISAFWSCVSKGVYLIVAASATHEFSFGREKILLNKLLFLAPKCIFFIWISNKTSHVKTFLQFFSMERLSQIKRKLQDFYWHRVTSNRLPAEGSRGNTGLEGSKVNELAIRLTQRFRTHIFSIADQLLT